MVGWRGWYRRIIIMVRRYQWWLCCLIISSGHGCHQPVWITILPRVRAQGKWLVSHSLLVGRVGMRTINPRCVVVVVVLLHRGRWQIIVIRSERAWWQPLSWSERAWWQPLSCSVIVTRRHWDDRQCWRSRFNVKMLWWCTTQNDGSWSLFNVDEGKFVPPPSTRWWGSRRVLYRAQNLRGCDSQHRRTTSTRPTRDDGSHKESF